MRPAALILATSLTGCSLLGPGNGERNNARYGDTLEVFDLAVGDLVITEIHNDPLASPTEAGGEWFEVLNTTALDIDMAGLVLSDNLASYTVPSPEIVVAGGRFVFGRQLTNNGGAPVDHAYGGTLALSNFTDEIVLSYPAGAIEFDRVDYDSSWPNVEGLSKTLHITAEDSVSNDDPANWCNGWSTTFGSGDYGTPGAANDDCTLKDFDADGEIDDTWGGTDCDDQDPLINQAATEIEGNAVDENCDGYLSIVGSDDLVAGDLVITEIMQNPDVIPDGNGEWFEFRNDTGKEIDLLNLVVSDSGGESFTITSNIVVAAGAYTVFAVEDDPAQNGNVPAVWDWQGYGLLNSSDDIILSTGGGTVIDTVAWDNGATFPDPRGAAMNLEPTRSNITDNDDGSFWCVAYTQWSGGDFGTPGAANPTCQDRDGDGFVDEAAPWNGTDCDDDDAGVNPGAAEIPGNGIDEDCDGLDADLGPDDIAAGDFVITEIHNHPTTGTSAEWFEITNVSANTYDLAGVVFSDLGTDAFTVDTFLVAAPGDVIVLARSDSPGVNGGVPLDYDYPSTFLLSDVADEIIMTAGTTEVDRVVYDSVSFPDGPGRTLSLEPTLTNITDNDDGSNWCDGYVAFGDGDLGTPGAVNSICIGRDVDGDGFADADFGGTDCDDKDEDISPAEDEVVDNGVDENCDGHDADIGIEDLVRGDLVITEIMNNPAAVTDGRGEYFEVRNLTGVTVDLIGLAVEGVSATDRFDVDEFVVMPVDGVVVFARDADFGDNGGFAGDFDYDIFSLLNGVDAFSLVRPSDGRVFDEVAYDDGATFPDAEGSSMQLSSDILDPDDNDLGSNWCLSRDAFGDGDYGTPLLDNISCDWGFDFDFDYTYVGSEGLPDANGSTSVVLLRDGTFTTGNFGEGSWSMDGTATGQTLTWTYAGTGVRYNGTRPQGGGCFGGAMSFTGDYNGLFSQTTDCP